MTLPTSYDNNGSNERENVLSNLICVKYFKNYFKKDRILMLIMTICVFILSPLITFFMYNNNSGSISYQSTVAAYNRVIYCIIAVICGVFLPLYLYDYNHSRKSSIFFNSLPIKKHTLYNTHALLGLVYFLVSVTINYIFVSLIIFASYPESDVIYFHLKSYIINLIIFIAVYCAMIFVANIAGTLLSSAILYVYVNFYLCGWILIMYLAFEMICSYTTFRLTGEMFFNTSFIMHTISKLESMSILQALLILAISAVLYFCGILLNRRLKTEKAESSIYFERFEQIFKYSMLAVVIIIAGMAFYSSGGGFGYYVGSAFGGVVGLIIMNIITRKNIKESFYKFRNFVIFFVIITLLSIPVIGILTFLDTYIPDTNSIAYVESPSNYSSNNIHYFMYHGNFYKWSDNTGKYNYNVGVLDNRHSIRIKDKSAVEAISDMQSIFQNSNKYNDTVEYYIYDTGRLSLFMGGFDYKFNTGYRLSKLMGYTPLYNICSSSEYKDAFYRLNSSEDYIKSTFYPLFNDDVMEEVYNRAYNASLNIDQAIIGEYNEIPFLNKVKMKQFIEALKKDITAISSDKQKFLAVYDGVLENNKQTRDVTTEYYQYGKEYSSYSYYAANNGSFKEYSVRISFYEENNNYNSNTINLQIVVNDYFTETLRFIEENLK